MNAGSALGAPRRSLIKSPDQRVDDAHFDVTPLVDLVFMMNIFFLVTWITSALAELDLPTARHCVAADAETSVVVSMRAGADRPTVYLGDDQSAPLPDAAGELEQRVFAAAESGKLKGKDTLLVKAERRVKLRDIVRVAGAAGAVEGMKLKMAVIEKE